MAPKNKPKNNNKPKNTPSNNTKRHDHSDPSQSGVNKTSNNNTMSEPNVGRSLNSNNGNTNNNIRRNTSTSSITSTDSNSSNDGSNSPLPNQRRTNPNLKKNNPSNNNSNSNLSPTSPSSHQIKRKQHIPPPLNTNLTPKPSERIELIWTCLKSPLKPPVRGFHSCTLVGDKLYIIGGDNRVEHFKDICIYDLKTNYWIKLSENSHLPAPRTGHSTVLYQDKLYLFGGKNENYYTSDLFIYDLREKVWSKDSQPHNKKTNLTPRAAHSCCCVDDKMYIFGGITSYQANDGRKASEYIDVLSMYDISQRKWKKPKNKGTAPSARAGHSCCVINRDIYIFGGRQGTILFNDLYKYNVDSEKWSKVQTKGEAPQPSAGHTMSAYVDKIVILGGSDWKKYPTEIYVFHIPSKVWVKCASLGITSGRFWHTATVYDENLFVYGGGTAELIDDIYSINLRSLNNISEATALTPQSSASPIPMPEIAVPTQTSTLKFKTIYKAEMRVFAKVPRDVTYLELKETISKSYGFSVVLKYVELDDEKDEITIKSDQELRDFIECFEEMGKGLRLELSEEKGHNYDSESDTEIDQEEMQPSSDGIKWRKGGLLGKGAYGEVYKGLNVNTGQWMAVKIIDLSATSEKEQKIVEKQIFNEINLMKDLCHENIVRYLGAEFNRKRTRLFIYIELVDGGSLSEILKNVGQLDESVVRQYTRQILFGLKYLHDKNIIHRDIKGGNILIETKSGTIKLADFGHSKKITENVQTSIRICGTPMWMAPEIIKESKYSKASDIWSVACTVIEMLTAEVPFPDLVSLENTGVMFRIATGATPHVPDNLSEEGKIFLAKCFHQNPTLRPSVDDLLHEPFLRTLRYVGSSYPNDETSSEEEEEEDDESFPSLDDSDYEEDSNSFDKGKRPISTGSEEFEGMESPTPNNKGKGPLIQEEEDEEEDFTDEDEDEDEEDFSDDESESSSYSEDKSSQSITQQLRNIQANNPILSMGLRGNLPTQSQVAHIAQLRRAPPPPLVSTPSTGTLRGVLRNDINQMNPYIAQTVTQVASTPSGTLNIGSSTSHSKSDTKSACDNDVMSFLQTKNQSTQ